MTSSRREVPARQVPAPANSRAGVPYTRFIPREELQDFASWTPGNFNTPAPERAAWPANQAPADFQPSSRPGNAGSTFVPGAGPAMAGQAAPAQAAPAPNPAADPQAVADAAAEAHEAALEAALRSELQAEFDERLRSDTAAQVQAARAQGYQDGYRDGLVALDSFKQSFAQQTSAQVGALLQSVDEALGALEQQLAGTVTRVATELARQVVRSELAIRPALITQVAQDAVNAVLMSAHHITVQLHPDDQALVAQGCAEALAARGARLLANPAVARGGCQIDSDTGTIDARIAQRWAQATQALGSGVSWTDHEPQPGADA
jgi:flagellar assembly protein FliH